jgi:hypothetical protein
MNLGGRMLAAAVLSWLLAGAMAANGGDGAPDGSALPVLRLEGLDGWKVEPFCGNPGVRTFVPGNRFETALMGVIVFDSQGNGYVAVETFIAVVTADGGVDVLTGQPGVTGNTDGPPGQATFGNALDLVLVNDNLLYVADAANFTLRKLERIKGVWQTETVAGAPGVEGHRDGRKGKSLLKSVFDSVTADENGTVYLFDGDWLRKFENGVLATLNPDGGTGYVNGPVGQARFAHSQGLHHGLTCDGKGGLYVADKVNMAIRRVDLKSGEVTTFAGVLPGEKRTMTRDGRAAEARFNPGGGPNIIFYDKTHDRFFCRSDDETTSRVILKGKDGWVVNTFMPGSLCGIDATGNIFLPGPGFLQIARPPRGGVQ